MKNNRNKYLAAAILLVQMLAITPSAQTGGGFTITQSVIASGGGQQAMGGQFSVDGTIGQALAGTNPSGGAFSIRSGFWTPAAPPTAAAASISGRIMTADGYGIRNVILSLANNSTGEIITIRSTPFGYYRFEEIPVGESYILTVSAKRFAFSPNERFIMLLGDLTDVDFTALPDETREKR